MTLADQGQHIARHLTPISATDGSAVEATMAALTRAIGQASARPGDRLPSERDLAALLGIGRTTLRRALQRLERAGLVARRPGRSGGTFVAEPKVDRDLRLYGGLPETLRSHGHQADTRVLLAAIVSASGETADALGVAPGDPVYEVARVRFSDGQPISLERSRFSVERFPGLLECPLGGSLYQLLHERYHAGPARAVERLEAVLATAEEAAALGLYAGAPLIAVDRVAYDADGRAVETSTDLYRGDRTRIVVWTDGERHDDPTAPHDLAATTPDPPPAPDPAGGRGAPQ
jgi:GntR family transcriptional regulator